MKRLYILLSASLFSALNLLADPSDYGRDYSVEDHSSSGFGPVGTVIAFIIGVVLVIFLLSSVFKDKNQNSEDKGCITIFFVILMGVAFFAMLAKCS